MVKISMVKGSVLDSVSAPHNSVLEFQTWSGQNKDKRRKTQQKNSNDNLANIMNKHI